MWAISQTKKIHNDMFWRVIHKNILLPPVQNTCLKMIEWSFAHFTTSILDRRDLRSKLVVKSSINLDIFDEIFS
jgi:hypothetical protein